MAKVSSEQMEAMRLDLLSESELTLNFLVLAISSCAIASFGLLTNSAAVIIGAMIIAPLMLPIRGLAFAAIDSEPKLLRRSINSLAVGTIGAVLMAAFLGLLVSVPASEFGGEILARTQPNLVDLGIALAAGGVSAFAKTRPEIRDSLAGTAIAVALMPPLCVVGITLSQGQLAASGGAFLLYLTNLLGITFSCIGVFALMGYYTNLRKVQQALWLSLSLTLLVAVPLFTSLLILIRQARLSATVRSTLQNQTVTLGQQAELLKMRVNWHALPWDRSPVEVILDVQTDDFITPKQVGLVEEFLYRQLRQRYRLIFRVNEFREVTSQDLDLVKPAKLELPADNPGEQPVPGEAGEPQERQRDDLEINGSASPN
ncbi:MAG: DUF389 domain-containing protein [Chloroflexaceae bacterium]|nr:DUF389 domain-containing protein [Chloroflexaceae bacterium]